MKIINKYIIKENITPFFGSLITITFIMIFNRLIELLNLIISKDLDFVTIIKIFAYSLPFMLALTIPMSVLVASIMAFGRLSVDRETIAFKASGINVYRLMTPTFVLSIFLFIFMIYFNNEILPNTNHKLKNLMMKISYTKPMTAIKPGQFTELKDYTIYAKEKKDDLLYGLVIYHRKKFGLPQIVNAEKGIVEVVNESDFKATLYNGEMQEHESKKPEIYTTTKFSKFVLNLTDMDSNSSIKDTNYRSDREMSAKMMQKEIEKRRIEISNTEKELSIMRKKLEEMKLDTLKNSEKQKWKQKMNLIFLKEKKIDELNKKISSYKVEIHKKYSLAFACIIFVLIGAPIGMMTKSSGIGMSFVVSSVVFLLYWVSLTLGEALADKGLMWPFLAMWISNIIFTIFGIFLAIYTVRESSIFDLNLLMEKIKKRFEKKNYNEFTR